MSSFHIWMLKHGLAISYAGTYWSIIRDKHSWYSKIMAYLWLLLIQSTLLIAYTLYNTLSYFYSSDDHPLLQTVCMNIGFLLLGFNPGQLNGTMVEWFVAKLWMYNVRKLKYIDPYLSGYGNQAPTHKRTIHTNIHCFSLCSFSWNLQWKRS